MLLARRRAPPNRTRSETEERSRTASRQSYRNHWPLIVLSVDGAIEGGAFTKRQREGRLSRHDGCTGADYTGREFLSPFKFSDQGVE
jgi:hypothetical protein